MLLFYNLPVPLKVCIAYDFLTTSPSQYQVVDGYQEEVFLYGLLS